MKAPDKIYLQACGSCDLDIDCKECQWKDIADFATWSEDKIFDRDIAYIRKDALLEWAKVMHDSNEKKRAIFIQGYSQAEKDLELTWEDIEKIEHLCEQVNREHNMGTFRGIPYGKSFYKEVSRRFKEAKK